MTVRVTDDDEPTNALTTSPAGGSGDTAEEDTADEIARLRDEIVLRRQRLGSSLQQLEHRVSEDLDWRRQVAAHPWLVLAGAAVVGFAIGRLTGGRASSKQAETIEPR
jgi:ElaB/YqjD/DUF883 family membrane-anchored ribosome-binding protein